MDVDSRWIERRDSSENAAEQITGESTYMGTETEANQVHRRQETIDTKIAWMQTVMGGGVVMSSLDYLSK